MTSKVAVSADSSSRSSSAATGNAFRSSTSVCSTSRTSFPFRRQLFLERERGRSAGPVDEFEDGAGHGRFDRRAGSPSASRAVIELLALRRVERAGEVSRPVGGHPPDEAEGAVGSISSTSSNRRLAAAGAPVLRQRHRFCGLPLAARHRDDEQVDEAAQVARLHGVIVRRECRDAGRVGVLRHRLHRAHDRGVRLGERLRGRDEVSGVLVPAGELQVGGEGRPGRASPRCCRGTPAGTGTA